MRAKWVYLMGVLILSTASLATSQTKPMPWEQWQFLVGDWEAVGHGTPGEGAGRFSFAFDLQNKVLVRKSHAEYPAAAGRPATVHDDLMVIYADEGGQKFFANYYDNEGHVIRYTAKFSSTPQSVVFISDPAPSQPRFRLTYIKQKDDSLIIRFEIAPPNDAEKFKVYVEGTARKA